MVTLNSRDISLWLEENLKIADLADKTIFPYILVLKTSYKTVALKTLRN